AAEINRGRVPYRDIVMPLPGPAAFYLLAGVFRLTGESFTAARVTMAVMSSALAALLYLLARGAMARWAAILVGLAFLSCRLCAVLLPTLASFAAAGALPSLYDQAVRTAFRGLVEFDYLRLPNLRPLLAQDPVLRAHIGEYAPSVLVTLYWDRITASPLFHDT